jgi:hypothetical protein
MDVLEVQAYKRRAMRPNLGLNRVRGRLHRVIGVIGKAIQQEKKMNGMSAYALATIMDLDDIGINLVLLAEK